MQVLWAGKQLHSMLAPGRCVGAAEQEDNDEPFADRMQRLAAQWREQQLEAVKLDTAIEANLKHLGV
jgi:type I restriction enzyme M protein